ncbi:MAG: Histidine kinase-, DNA gyrase B-, and HSP90-like protein ATPase [Parcubacteria group bacterium Gr01-1014_33]|nr:MAG: Histidine kinase-, DNA gyrase B-, and HSP90-like protein ATPase [Parcubacteria group bacterium Gr01-1014_33]
MSTLTHIPVVFDKSHLLTIGERLYSTSLDLIRELVSNAYDADATRVEIEIGAEEITVEDNGSGMDQKSLFQYFTIGSQEKRMHPLSPKFQRKRIGEFGIGKFSVLSIARKFALETWQRESQFRARVVFDAAKWSGERENWSIPCEVLPFDSVYSHGTRVSIQHIKKQLDSTSVARHIRERMPVGREDFRIFVNGAEVTATTIPGKRFPVFFMTPFGEASGEIILANLPATQRTIADAGITIRVKQISVTKSIFGFEASHSVGVSRLRGSVNADFLPITSSRDQIMWDSDQYKIFYAKMREIIFSVLREAHTLQLQKEITQASHVLRDALDKIGRAFKKNPEMFEEEGVSPPLGEYTSGAASQEGYVISKAEFVDGGTHIPPRGEIPDGTFEDLRAKPKRKHVILANRAVIRKMRFGNLGIVCRMERYGPKYPPSFLEEGIIFINIDHPLYRKQMENTPLLTMFISTLLTKELALKKHPNDSAAAYTLQHHLLTDAFKDVRKM